MNVNIDLLLSILALDSYNRGYGVGITSLPGLKLDEDGHVVSVWIGNAKIINDSSISLGLANTQGAGFYAIAYDMTGVAGFSAGQTVIAYRGTDADLADPFDTGRDVCNGASALRN